MTKLAEFCRSDKLCCQHGDRNYKKKYNKHHKRMWWQKDISSLYRCKLTAVSCGTLCVSGDYYLGLYNYRSNGLNYSHNGKSSSSSSSSWMFFLKKMFFVFLWLSCCCIYPSSCDKLRGTSSLVSTSVIYQSGDTAILPCDISVPSQSNNQDELVLVMWYREDVRSPIYSIDARGGNHIPSSVGDVRSHWVDTTLFKTNRVVFDTSPSPDKAKLKIFNVSESDDGLYRCRVDFKMSQTRTSRLNLTVVVRPEKPIIKVLETGESVEGYLGPYQIGTSLSLVCQVNGGKPLPRVVWYRNGRPFPSKSGTWTTKNSRYHENRDDTFFSTRPYNKESSSISDIEDNQITLNRRSSISMYANITIESLSRDDVQTELTCEASNFEATKLRTSVEIDMKYRAHNVTIHNKNKQLRADSQHEFTCEALGSRPAAVLTWWLDEEQFEPQFNKVQITSSVSGELSTSTLTYTPQPSDSGKILYCRATNPELKIGVLDDKWELDVKYPPQVSIQLGKSLVASDIREGVDVYFDCMVSANPPPKSKLVTWLHNGHVLRQNRNDDLRARMVLPSVNDPNVLVLQGVKKAARGNYSCKVGNGIPSYNYEVESKPVFLDVKFPPVCSPKGVKVYGVAKRETAHIACKVEANPPKVNFRWTFNNSAEAKDVEQRFIKSNGSQSILTFTPTRQLEYGTLMCWSENMVGAQKDPCIFHIIAAGKPESVQNCSVINESTDSFQVNCYPGFNGGLPQHFTLAVYKVTGAGGGDLISLGGQATERKPTANLSSTIPRFEVSGLEPGSKYIGELVGHNVKGAGDAKYIHVYTLKLPEKLIPQLEEPNHNSDEGTHQLELNPMMLTILGVVSGVLVVIILVLAAIRVHASRNRRRRSGGGSGRGSGGPGSDAGSGNKVVVTTIEELDLDHNVNTERNLMLLDSLQGGGSRHNPNSTKLNNGETSATVAGERIPFMHQSVTSGGGESSIHFEELMATAAADARGTTCASSNGNKGIVSSSSSNFPLASSRSNITPSNVAPSNNLTYLTNINRVNAQQGNPAFHDLPQRGNINPNIEKPEDVHQHSTIPQQQRFGSLEDCSVLGNRTPPPPPPPANADHRFNHPPNIRQPHSFRNSSSNSRSQTGSLPNSGPLNYCTIRRPTTSNLNMNQQKRGVQFADQQDSSSNGQEEMDSICVDQDGRNSSYDTAHHHGVPHNHRFPNQHIHASGNGHQIVSHNHPSLMFATMRPNQRQPTLTTGGAVCLGSAVDTSFHDFVPPPPPMFENGGGTQCQGNKHVVPAIPHKNEEDKKSQKKGLGRPVVAPKPKIGGKGSEKGKEKKKRESTV